MQAPSSSEERWALGGLVTTFVVTAAWWALALWPVQDAPFWLARTRYVCFGVAESGLPDAGGWIGLIAGPLGMLGIVLVGWSGGVRSVLLHARTSMLIRATLSLLVTGTFLMVAGASMRVRQAQAAVTVMDQGTPLPPASYPRLDRPAPKLELVAQDGRVHSLSELRGRPVLVTFAYAHCATVCPVIVRDVLRAQAKTRGLPLQPAVIVVTLDPWRDTPSRLPAMARDWAFPAEGAWMMGGAVESVEAVHAAWEVPTSRNEQTGEVTHPALAYVVDEEGRIAFASTGGSDVLIELLKRLHTGD
jgi:protein SCO1